MKVLSDKLLPRFVLCALFTIQYTHHPFPLALLNRRCCILLLAAFLAQRRQHAHWLHSHPTPTINAPPCRRPTRRFQSRPSDRTRRSFTKDQNTRVGRAGHSSRTPYRLTARLVFFRALSPLLTLSIARLAFPSFFLLFLL